MSKAIITGASGQIGRALVPELLDGGHEVICLDHSDGDLTDPQIADRLIADRGAQTVIHLAAQVGRLWCDDDPAHAWRSNVVATVNVAYAAVHAGARLIYCSTSEVYGDYGTALIREGDACHPSSGSYADTKYVGELAAEDISGNDLQIWRPVMAYGPGVPAGRGRAAILNVLQAAIDNKPIVVHKGGARSWCYIDDIARGMRIAFEDGEPGIYNIGRDDDLVNMLWLAELACEITGSSSSISEEVAPPSQTLVKNISTRKITSLGFEPEVSLRDGMERTAEWLRSQR